MSQLHNNAVILARVSSKGQEDEGYSLESQVKLLKLYCDNNSLNTRKIYKIAESASKSEQRKTFKDAMQFIAENKIKNLVVEKVDRHVRNLHDAVETHDWLLADENRKVHFVKDSLVMHKNSRSQEWLNWGIRVVMAKNYIDNLREEAMKGWAEKLAQGWLPSPPPPGYHTITQDGKRIHVPNPQTARSMQKVFHLALDPRHSLVSLRDVMTSYGIVTKHGRPFSKSAVHRILKNPFYIGINRHNGQDYPGKQERLISDKLFFDVQKKMSAKRPSKYNKHNPLFKGMVTCSHCNKTITWQKQKGRYYGACQRKLPDCKSQRLIREDVIQERIESMLKDLVCPSQSVINWLINLLQDDFNLTVVNTEQAEKAIEERIRRIKVMDDMLYDDKLAGYITAERYIEKHEAFKDEIKLLEKQRGGLTQEYETKYMDGISVIELSQDAIKQFKDKNIDNDYRRTIITKLIENISMKNSVLSVNYTKLAGAIARNSIKSKEIIAYGKTI